MKSLVRSHAARRFHFHEFPRREFGCRIKSFSSPTNLVSVGPLARVVGNAAHAAASKTQRRPLYTRETQVTRKSNERGSNCDRISTRVPIGYFDSPLDSSARFRWPTFPSLDGTTFDRRECIDVTRACSVFRAVELIPTCNGERERSFRVKCTKLISGFDTRWVWRDW